MQSHIGTSKGGNKVKAQSKLYVRDRKKDYINASLGCFMVLLSIGFVLLDAYSTRAFLRTASAVVTSESEPGTLPVHPEVRFHSNILLHNALDARWYVMHTENMLRSGAWRVRKVETDNAPLGREMHWSSGMLWTLGGISTVISWKTGRPALQEVANAAYWFGPITLIGCLLLVAFLMSRCWGLPLAGVLCLMVVTTFPCFDMFRAGEVDHHGLAAMAVLFMLFGLLVELIKPAKLPARMGTLISALAGAVGLWLSASTMIPVLGATGLTVLVWMLVRRFRGLSPQESANWQFWGNCGATFSLLFYLIEYFPNHMGLRLEVNHPLYAFAWWGGGQVLAWAQGSWTVATTATRFKFIFACLAAVLPPVVIVLMRAEVFTVADPFLLALHRDFIREFAPAAAVTLDSSLFQRILDVAWWPMLAFGILLGLHFRGKLSPHLWLPVCILLAAGLTAQLEAWQQVRWTGLSVTIWILVAAAAMHFAFQAWQPKRPSKMTLALMIIWLVIGFAGFPLQTLRSFFALDQLAANLPKMIIPSILLRDIGRRLAESDPSRQPVVLSDATSTTELIFYGGVRGIGTLYWENNEGLKRAARLFSQTDEASARAALKEAGVTHIVIPFWDAFSDFSNYEQLLKLGGEQQGEGEGFFQSLLAGKLMPDWIRPLFYEIPPAFGLGKSNVRIYEIVPDQSLADSRRWWGIYLLQNGKHRQALEVLESALLLTPTDPDLAGWVKALRSRFSDPSKKQP